MSEAHEIGYDLIRIIPALRNACPVCAASHDPDAPHNRDSLYYQMRFFQQNGRWPTWNDAMRHCDRTVREMFIRAYRARGIEIDATEPDTKQED